MASLESLCNKFAENLYNEKIPLALIRYLYLVTDKEVNDVFNGDSNSGAHWPENNSRQKMLSKRRSCLQLGQQGLFCSHTSTN